MFYGILISVVLLFLKSLGFSTVPWLVIFIPATIEIIVWIFLAFFLKDIFFRIAESYIPKIFLNNNSKNESEKITKQ